MLDNDPIVDSLLSYNPFHGEKRPKFIRALHFDYKFAASSSSAKDVQSGQWWTRKYKGQYLPVVEKATLRDAYKKFGWKWKK